MPENGYEKKRVRAYAAEHGLTYQQAHQALHPPKPHTTSDHSQSAAPEPGQYPPAVLATPDVGELVRLHMADMATAGITMTEDKARQDVAFTIGMLKKHLTPAPLPSRAADTSRLMGPHCTHEECGWHTCQDGYAWGACRTAGCNICGAPPVNFPEHWAGSVVAHAIMSPGDVARAQAHLEAYPLLRRPNDPPVIPDERALAAYGDPRGDYDEYDNEPLTAYEMDPDVDDPADDPDRIDYFGYERGQ